MSPRIVTYLWIIGLVLYVASFLLVDAYALKFSPPGEDWTITNVVRTYSARWPIIIVVVVGAIGLVAGHFWWQAK